MRPGPQGYRGAPFTIIMLMKKTTVLTYFTISLRTEPSDMVMITRPL